MAKRGEQTEAIKTFLQENGMFGSCNEALKAFQKTYPRTIYYSAFRRVYKLFRPAPKDEDGIETKAIPVDPSVVKPKGQSYETIEKISKNGIKYLAWAKVPKEAKPTKLHKTHRVYVAGTRKRASVYLHSVHEAGEPMWPEEGVTVVDETGKKRYMTMDMVRLHPSEFRKKTHKLRKIGQEAIKARRKNVTKKSKIK